MAERSYWLPQNFLRILARSQDRDVRDRGRRHGPIVDYLATSWRPTDGSSVRWPRFRAKRDWPRWLDEPTTRDGIPQLAQTGDNRCQLVTVLKEQLRLSPVTNARRRSGEQYVASMERHPPA